MTTDVEADADRLVDAAMHRLDLCGCDEPLPVLLRLIDLLREFDKPHEERTLWKTWAEGRWAWTLVLYTLDRAQLIEHGGTVSAGWITEAGREFLETYGPLSERFVQECPACKHEVLGNDLRTGCSNCFIQGPA